MLSAVSPNVLFSVIEQRHSMDLANFLLWHWGSRYVLLSNCVYYLIPVGNDAFEFHCDGLFVAVIMKVLRIGCRWYDSRMNCVVSYYFNDRFHMC